MVIPHCELTTATKHDILGDLYTEATQSEEEDVGLALLGDRLHSHRADVATPSVLHTLVIDVQLDILPSSTVTNVDFLQSYLVLRLVIGAFDVLSLGLSGRLFLAQVLMGGRGKLVELTLQLLHRLLQHSLVLALALPESGTPAVVVVTHQATIGCLSLLRQLQPSLALLQDLFSL